MRMLAALIVLAGSVFAQPAVPPCSQSPATAVRYTMLLSGNHAGQQTTWLADDGFHGCFEFNDRGRGPLTRTLYRFDSAGIPTAIETHGNDYLKGPADETFSRGGDASRWKNKAEQGSSATRGFYVSMYGPPVEQALLAAALLKAPNRTLALLPGGEARLEKVTTATVTNGANSQTVTGYAISGLGFSPSYIWLDKDNQMFGAVSGWSSVIREGWESNAKQLDDIQDKLDNARYADLARKLGHIPQSLVIRHARLFDAESATIKPDMTIVVTGNRIASVSPDAQAKVPDGAEQIDASGKTVLPGLWDMHVHLGGDDGLLNIANGITSVRDLANDTDKLLAMRKSFDEGSAIGPRIVMAGIIDGPGPYAGPTKVLVDTPEKAVAAVDNYAKLGYVQIKIYSSVKPELVPVITAEAHKLGLRVSGHVPAFMTAEQAINEGYNEIQHANFLFLNFWPEVKDTRTPARFTEVAKRAATLDLNSPPVQNFVKLLQDRHITLDPTLNVFADMFDARAGQVAPTLAEVADRLPVQVRRGALAGGLPIPEGMDQRYRDSFRAMEKMVLMMYNAGIPIEAGTDSLAGFTLHSELELDAEAGIPAPKVLQLATLGAARIMSKDRELGSIAPGKLADIIVVDGQPDTRISDIRRVTTVIKDGTVYQSADLDRALGVQPIGR